MQSFGRFDEILYLVKKDIRPHPHGISGESPRLRFDRGASHPAALADPPILLYRRSPACGSPCLNEIRFGPYLSGFSNSSIRLPPLWLGDKNVMVTLRLAPAGSKQERGIAV